MLFSRLITYMAAGTLYILLALTGLQLYTACSQLGCCTRVDLRWIYRTHLQCYALSIARS